MTLSPPAARPDEVAAIASDRVRPSWSGALRRRLFGISGDEARFDRRGFPPCTPAARERFETIGRTFIRGYCAALEDDQPATLAERLARMAPELSGFAFEGAAMGLAILDLVTPWRRDRLTRFLAGPGEPHAYMVHVGAGWALARLGHRVGAAGPGAPLEPRTRDPLLRWLLLDGYGFHEGYFHWRRVIRERRLPERLSGYARRVFDQGLGRSLWFVAGADGSRVRIAIEAFPATRRADLWSGVGLACAYAGGLDQAGLEILKTGAGASRAAMAQGAAFAAKARARAGNPAEQTERACAVLCGMSAEAAARVTDEALAGLPADGPEPAYEAWRLRVQSRLRG